MCTNTCTQFCCFNKKKCHYKNNDMGTINTSHYTSEFQFSIESEITKHSNIISMV